MQGHSDLFLAVVIGVAFVAGYSIVSFIISRVKALNRRPSLMNEPWKQPAIPGEEPEATPPDSRRDPGGQHTE